MTPPPHPGAPKGNTNALKHGFYSRAFRATEQTGLDDFDPTSLQNEIELMRVFMLRTAELGEQAATLAESMTLLNVLSRAALSLGALIRTHQALTLRKQSADLTDLTAQLNAANRRATALLKLLPPQQPDEVTPTARRASYIPSPSGRGQGEGSSLPPTPVRAQAEGSSLPPTPTSGQTKDSSLLPIPSSKSGQEKMSLVNSCPTFEGGVGGDSSHHAYFSPPRTAPTYTLGPAPCFPSPQCFTCPERPLCPDCQTYLHTHTPPQIDAGRKIEGVPISATKAAETSLSSPNSSPCPSGKGAGGIGLDNPVTPSPDTTPPTLPYPLSLFYTLQPPNCSELFPPNNSPTPGTPQSTV